MGRFFDSLFGDIYNNETFHNRQQFPSRPLWVTLLEEDDDRTKEHLWSLYRAFYENAFQRIERMRLNLCAYVGLQHFGSQMQLRITEGMQPQYLGNSPRFTTALIQAMVNQQVTQALLFPTEVSVIPIGTDFSNQIESEAVKDLLDSYERAFNEVRNKEIMNRRARIMGEAYRFIFWNKDKGGLDKTYAKRKKANKTVEIVLPNGDVVECERPIYQGDLDEVCLQSWDVGLENKSFIDNVTWGFHRYLVPTDELKVDHPDVADEIEPGLETSAWNLDYMSSIPVKDHTLVTEFYFRSTPYLPLGYRCKLTPEVILEQGPNPFPHIQGSELGNIPYERLTDLDIDGSLHGWSRINNQLQHSNQYDNSTTMVGRNLFIGGHPKWMMPKGAASITRLANAKTTVVQYSGPTAPQLVTFNTVPQGAMDYRTAIKDDMEYTYGSSSIARGEPPKGVTANAALQFLDQQQQEASSLWQLKQDQHTVNTYAKRLAVISEYFDPDDERFVKVLGQDKNWYTQIFDVKSLDTQFEIGLMVSSDLPKRKDARMQTIFQMSQIWPTLFPPEAVAEMFKLGHVTKFLSAAASSYQAAERENWRARRGQKVQDPIEYEDHIIHWRTHKRDMQSADFRLWAKDRQDELTEHLLTTEYLMLQKMKKNQMYGAQLQQLGDWPLLLPLPDDFGRTPGAPVSIPTPPPEQGQGGAQKTGDADINQQRFANGQFGQGRQAIAA